MIVLVMAQGRSRSDTGTIIVGVHNRQRVQERFNYEDTIDIVLERFARQLKVDAGSISLLHQGSRLDRRATVQVQAAIGRAGRGGAGRRVWCKRRYVLLAAPHCSSFSVVLPSVCPYAGLLPVFRSCLPRAHCC